MAKQRSAHLHPLIEERALACAARHGAFYSRLCNAALYHFLEAPEAAQQNALRIVGRMRIQRRKAARRMSARRVPANA